MPAYLSQMCCKSSQLEDDPKQEKAPETPSCRVVKDWQHWHHIIASKSSDFVCLALFLNCFLLLSAMTIRNQGPKRNPAERSLCRTRCLQEHQKAWDRKLGAWLQGRHQDWFALRCPTQGSELHLHLTGPALMIPTKQDGSRKADFGNGQCNQDQREGETQLRESWGLTRRINRLTEGKEWLTQSDYGGQNLL